MKVIKVLRAFQAQISDGEAVSSDPATFAIV
jgi:hypothetical protein